MDDTIGMVSKEKEMRTETMEKAQYKVAYKVGPTSETTDRYDTEAEALEAYTTATEGKVVLAAMVMCRPADRPRYQPSRMLA